MKRAFIYKDEQSHKFWWIDYGDRCLAVNYGKYGNIGKFEVKDFDTEQECVKEAEKLIHSKEKKGYVEEADFDFNHRLYIDSEIYGPHPKTSHPRFAEHFIDELYYDCTNEDSPFGSDEGSDALSFIASMIRKKPDLDFSDIPRKLVEEYWGMEYIPVGTPDAGQINELASANETDMTQSDRVTYATAFAQIKITGSISPDLRERGVKAIQRFALTIGEDLTDVQSRMIDDLLSFI